MEDPSVEPRIPENSEDLAWVGYRFEDYRRMHRVLVAVVGSLADGKLLHRKISRWCEKLHSRLDCCDSILDKCTVKNGGALSCIDPLMKAGYQMCVETLNTCMNLQIIDEESFAGSIDVVKHHAIECFKRKCFYASKEYAEMMQTLERAACDAKEEYIDRLKVYDYLAEMMYSLDRVHNQLRKMRFRLQDG